MVPLTYSTAAPAGQLMILRGARATARAAADLHLQWPRASFSLRRALNGLLFLKLHL